MSEPIGPGDLVMVTKACCDRFVRSPVFTVSRLEKNSSVCACPSCWQWLPFRDWAIDQRGDEFWMYPLPWLKKIDPATSENAASEEMEYGI